MTLAAAFAHDKPVAAGVQGRNHRLIARKHEQEQWAAPNAPARAAANYGRDMTDEAASGARAVDDVAAASEHNGAAGRERDPAAAGREVDPVAEAWAARPNRTQDLPPRTDFVVVGGGLMGTATA